MFVLAGWCRKCGAVDLLFARGLSTSGIFFVCAACGNAGKAIDDWRHHIGDAHDALAPNGWTLATRVAVEAAGLGEEIAGTASEGYIDLISWYPGFERP